MRTLSRMHRTYRRARRRTAGFSLVELLVVIAIIALITATILARYGSFNSTVLLKDLAYDVALAVREAQILGVSVRGAAGTFSDSYGVHFVAGATSFTQFRDVGATPNGYTESDEVVATYTIGRNNSIGSVCSYSGGSADCSHDDLDVVFERPEPDALFFSNGVALDTERVSIVVTAPNGNTRTVHVYPTGQISIE